MINKSTNQLAFYQGEYLLDVFPVATGRTPLLTPEGKWRVLVKFVQPSWRNPKGGPVIPGGVPANPLGPRWLGLNALGTGGSSYGIHGNNNPSSIGTYASSGCVRMRNPDILWLYPRVPAGTSVDIINDQKDPRTMKRVFHVTVNSIPVEYAPHLGPVQSGEKNYLPVRPTAAALGYHMSWDASSNTLLLANIDREVFLTLDSSQVTVNGEDRDAGGAPFLLEGLTYVSDAFFREFLGAELQFGEKDRTVALTAPPDPSGGRLARRHLSMRVNGQELPLPEAFTPLTDGELLLVPLRPFCAAVEAEVGWKDAAKAVEIKRMGRYATIPLNGGQARVNGAVLETPAALFVKDGFSYVNLRFLSEAFGFTAKVDDAARTLEINTFNGAAMTTNPFRQSYPSTTQNGPATEEKGLAAPPGEPTIKTNGE